RADEVARDQVSEGAAGADADAVALVAANDVAGAGDRAADGIRVRIDVDAFGVIRDDCRADGVGADQIALDDVGAAVHPDTLRVPRDEVASAGSRSSRDAADGVSVSVQLDAIDEIAAVNGAIGVGSDVVARDEVAGRRGARDEYAGLEVVADDIA